MLFLGGLMLLVLGADPAGLLLSLAYMVVSAAAVLALLYWREGMARWGAAICVTLYVPAFLLI